MLNVCSPPELHCCLKFPVFSIEEKYGDEAISLNQLVNLGRIGKVVQKG